MSSAIRRVGWMAGAVLAIACAVSIAAWAGGSGFGDDDDNSEEEGPSYFGFVRDTSGATVPDAKGTVGVKNRGGVVTRTDLLGTYKVPGFGKEVDAQRRRGLLRQAGLQATARRPTFVAEQRSEDPDRDGMHAAAYLERRGIGEQTRRRTTCAVPSSQAWLVSSLWRR